MKRTRVLKASLALIGGGVALSAVLLLSGCQKGTTGFFRPVDSQVEQSITNTLGVLRLQVAPALPEPFSTATDLGAGLVLAALAAWQTFSHRKITAINKVLNGSITKTDP
jgi:hypothetical protein